MAELWCPRCDSHVATAWKIIGTTQWYTCARGHKFSNPIVIPDATVSVASTESTESENSAPVPEGS